MPNPHKGDVAFVAAGQTYTLRYSIDAICVMEERTGKTLLELAIDMKDFKTIKMAVVRDIFYAGLIEHHPEITVKEAGELILSAGGSLVVMNKFNEAIAAAYPKPEASGTSRPRQERKVTKGTGLRS